jgi:hypothetical protein
MSAGAPSFSPSREPRPRSERRRPVYPRLTEEGGETLTFPSPAATGPFLSHYVGEGFKAAVS